MKILEVLDPEKNRTAKEVVVTVSSKSAEPPRRIVESTYIEEAGQTKQWPGGYSFRYDKRSMDQGGDQLHIMRKGDAWAYRYTGDRSERNKYTLPATNTVKDIVRHAFKLTPEVIIEAKVVAADNLKIAVEVVFMLPQRLS